MAHSSNAASIGLSAAILLLTTLPAAALDFDESHWCRNGLFPSTTRTITLMRVAAKAGAPLLWDGGSVDGCPQKIAGCGSTLVAAGREVLVSGALGNFRCVFFPAPHGGDAGWVPVEDLVPSETAVNQNPPLRAWAGRWVDGADEISIFVSARELSGQGSAIWNGGNGNIHEGGFEARAIPQNGRVLFVEDDCQVSARLVARYLVVSDNFSCGGMNVRFDGVYTLAKKR